MNRTLTAIDQTRIMLRWFISHEVNRWDLAVRRHDGAFMTKDTSDLDLDMLERRLPWVRWANAHGSEIYLRPARGHSWPMLFLDDVAPSMAQRIAARYASLIVRTSSQGGCHLWLHLSRPLNETERRLAQCYLQPLAAADPASTSGEHFGRLAGTRNHKRSGQWTTLLAATIHPPWNPTSALSPPQRVRRVASSTLNNSNHHRDESVAEFSWCCHCIRNGLPPQVIVDRLSQRAQSRGKRKPMDYALRTVRAAMNRLDARH